MTETVGVYMLTCKTINRLQSKVIYSSVSWNLVLTSVFLLFRLFLNNKTPKTIATMSRRTAAPLTLPMVMVVELLLDDEPLSVSVSTSGVLARFNTKDVT